MTDYPGDSIEAEQISISHIAQIFDSNLAGEKSVGRHLAQEREELHALAQAGIFVRILAIGDQIENFLLLLRRHIRDRVCHSDPYTAPSSHIMPPPSFN